MRLSRSLPILSSLLLIFAQPCWAARVVLVAGGGENNSPAQATRARLGSPFGVDFDSAGNTLIAEFTGGRVLKVDSKGMLATVAGNPTAGDRGDGGPAAQASFNSMHSLTVDRHGNIFLADTYNNRVRKIDARTGVISAFAGDGQKGFSGDGGPAASARFGGVYCVAFDPKQSHLYVADLDNRRIRAIDMETGTVQTVAGNGKRGVPDDGGPAAEAPLLDPRAVAADSRGNVFVLERSGNALRAVDSAGKIKTLVGTGEEGLSGDGGDARLATLRGPKHLCIDRDGNVIIADTENHVVRKYLPGENKIVRVAGSGKRGTAGVGGPPLELELNQPHGVAIDRDGKLYIADSSNHRVLKVEP